MRNLILLSVIILSFVIQTHAQWYSRCDVTNLDSITSIEFECLWNKTNNRIVSSSAITVIGTSIIVGTLISASNFDTGPESELVVPGIAIHALGLLLGFSIDLIGIPILISGVNQRFQLKNLPNYKEFNKPDNVYGKDDTYISIAPQIGKIQIDNAQFYGLSLKFNF